jgi:hypothetical protein
MIESKNVMSIQELASKCGYFSNKYKTNKGRNCLHPKQEITQYSRGAHKTIGMCHHCTCPIANHIKDGNVEVLKPKDLIL